MTQPIDEKTGASDPGCVGLPWSSPPALAKKPAGIEYGYVPSGSARGDVVLIQCGLAELEAKVASGEAAAVAVPEYQRLAPPSIVRGLRPAVLERERARHVKQRQNAIFNVCLFGGIVLYSLQSKDPAWQIVLLMFVILGLVPLVQYLIGALRRRISGEGTFEEMRERTLFAFWLGAGRTPATTWGVRVLVAVFVAQVLAPAFASGDLVGGIFHFGFVVGRETIEAGALVKPLVWQGEVWRLITAGLVHGGLLHIGVNGIAFVNVGTVLERFYGFSIMLMTFFCAVIGGSLASLILMPNTPSVGASGGIFGLIGFLLVVGLRHRHALPADFAKSIIRSVLFMAALGFLARHYIDNAAHAGGFLTGCLIALPLTKDVRELGSYPTSNTMRRIGLGSAGVMGIAALWVVARLAAASGLTG